MKIMNEKMFSVDDSGNHCKHFPISLLIMMMIMEMRLSKCIALKNV
jgi:hypothetical protein